MKNIGTYIKEVYQRTAQKNSDQPEFLQSVREFLETAELVLQNHPRWVEQNVLERMLEPDRLIQFSIRWMDDLGRVNVNRGFRIQYSSAIGPYKGGLRFDPSVNQSIIKFLGFEQVLKNSLTGLPIGGGKGGSDFNPKGRSDNEIMRFCQSFMTELQKYIGPDEDIPAGDIGVGPREIGYLFGQYKKLNHFQNSVLTNKPLPLGGSLGRKEATGYGLVYFTKAMIENNGKTLKDKKVVVSGSGNVALYAIEKITELGGSVVGCSDSSGYILDRNGIDLEAVKQIKEINRGRIEEYMKEHPYAEYHVGSIWKIKESYDIALPCATQNEISADEAECIIKSGVFAVAEGANMPSQSEAIKLFKNKHILFGPAKAANAGGVAVSALEMSQNSQRLNWSTETVDDRLKEIMNAIFQTIRDKAHSFDLAEDYSAGANIVSFERVAEALMIQGVI